MKRISLAFSSLLLLLLPTLSLAETQVRPDGLEVSIIHEIPGKYAKVKIVGVDPDAPLDKEKLLAIFKEHLDRLGYKQMDLVIYNRGQDGEDAGFRGVSSRKIYERNKALLEVTSPADIEMFQNGRVYYTHPNDLYQAFVDNPAGAMAIYGGQVIRIPEIRIKRTYMDRGMYCFEARMDHIMPGGRIDACADRQHMLFTPYGDVEMLDYAGEIINFHDNVLLMYGTRVRERVRPVPEAAWDNLP